MSSIRLDEYIATRYGVYQGAQKDFLQDNSNMNNPEVSRWCATGWRVDLSTGDVFKESKKKVKLIDAKFDVVARGEPVNLGNCDLVCFVSEDDAKNEVNGVFIKGVLKDGFLTIDKNNANNPNAPVFFNTSLWRQNGSQLSIVDQFVITEVN